MLVIDFHESPEFKAGDNTILREFLHPDKQEIQLGYSLAHATLEPGKTSQPHALKSSEVYYILEGQGRMHIDGEEREVFPHQTIYIPPNARQFIANTGNTLLKFLCIVDPCWRTEDEIVF